MPSEQPPAEQLPIEPTEEDVEAALEACDGDARAAIKALLVLIQVAEREASWGYVRGRPSRRTRDAAER